MSTYTTVSRPRRAPAGCSESVTAVPAPKCATRVTDTGGGRGVTLRIQETCELMRCSLMKKVLEAGGAWGGGVKACTCDISDTILVRGLVVCPWGYSIEEYTLHEVYNKLCVCNSVWR